MSEVPETGVIIALTNAVEGKEKEFNEWYDSTHAKDLLKVPGIVAAQRFELGPVGEGLPPPQYRYLTIYETEGPLELVLENLQATRDSRYISPAISLDGALVAYRPMGPRMVEE